jgi:hypothetical protein
MSDIDKDRINYDNDRDFGMRDVEYNPIDRDANDQFDPDFKEEDEEEEKGTNWGLVIGIIAAVLLIVWALIYIFVFDGAKSLGLVEEEQPVIQQIEPEPEPVIEEPEPEPEPVVDEPDPEPETDGTNAYSDVVVLSEPTGKTYVVVGSFIDDDLAMDLAAGMESQGGGARVIPPFGNQSLAYRVAVADFNTFQQASNNIEKFRSTFGPETWILKY